MLTGFFHWPHRWIHDYQDACVEKLEKFINGELSATPQLSKPAFNRGPFDSAEMQHGGAPAFNRGPFDSAEMHGGAPAFNRGPFDSAEMQHGARFRIGSSSDYPVSPETSPRHGAASQSSASGAAADRKSEPSTGGARQAETEAVPDKQPDSGKKKHKLTMPQDRKK